MNFMVMITSMSFDIIVLQEIWLQFFDCVCIPSYTFIQWDKTSRGGGLLTLTSSNVNHSATAIERKMSAEYKLLGISLTAPTAFRLYLFNVCCPTGLWSKNNFDFFFVNIR